MSTAADRLAALAKIEELEREAVAALGALREQREEAQRRGQIQKASELLSAIDRIRRHLRKVRHLKRRVRVMGSLRPLIGQLNDLSARARAAKKEIVRAANVLAEVRTIVEILKTVGRLAVL